MESQNPSTPNPSNEDNNVIPISSNNPPPSPTPSPSPTPTQITASVWDSVSAATPSAFKSLYHRRVCSDGDFQIGAAARDNPGLSGEALDGGSMSSPEDMGGDDDPVSAFLELDDVGGAGQVKEENDGGGGGVGVGGGGGGGGGEAKMGVRFRRRRGGSGDVIMMRKPMSPEKLAEIWAQDPKRVKRILANRQSAARSKEKKVRYTLQLERELKSLKDETTHLFAQLTMYKRNTKELSAQNAELKRCIQTIEQEAEVGDAICEELRVELEMLKIESGEMEPPPTEPLPASPSTSTLQSGPYSPLASPSTAHYTPLTSPSTLQPAHYSSPLTSPSSAYQTAPYSPLVTPSTLTLKPPYHSPLPSPSSTHPTTPYSPLVTPSTLTLRPPYHSPLTSPSTVQTTTAFSQAVNSPSPQTTNFFPVPQKEVPILAPLPPLHYSVSSLRSRRFASAEQSDTLVKTEGAPFCGGETEWGN